MYRRAKAVRIPACSGSGEKIIVARSAGSSVGSALDGPRVCPAGKAALDHAADGLESGMPIEAVLVDLRDALLELERVLGIDADDAVLDRIFATFCVGK